MISIEKIRISNYKSIEYLEILSNENSNIFIGQNNAGKSNILKAIKTAFDYRYIPNEYDFYDKMTKHDLCYIDIMLTPNNSNQFDEDWLMLFGEYIAINKTGKESFTMRTVLSFDSDIKKYDTERFPILDWNSDQFKQEASRISSNIRKSIGCYYLDTNRDIANELRVRNSNFSKLMKSENYNLDSIDFTNIEKALNIVNNMILKRLPSINEIEDNLSDISTTIDNIDSVKILPIPNRYEDLDKGVDILIGKNTNHLPVLNYGDGTRSWVSILTLSAYILSVSKQLILEGLPHFAIILVEEPESHLHPQAQNKIISQLNKLNGQLFITTHSSNIISELDVSNVFRIANDDGTKIVTSRNKVNEKVEYHIKNHILPFHSDILFSNMVILVEGMTEKILIGNYIKFRMRKNAFELGINIVNVDGRDSLKTFRQFCEIHNINNIVYADGDAKTIEVDFKKLGLSSNNIIFTLEKEIENELIVEQYDVCRKIYMEKKPIPKSIIEEKENQGTLKDDILTFLKNNKTRYPYWLNDIICEEFRIKSIEKIIKIIGRTNR